MLPCRPGTLVEDYAHLSIRLQMKNYDVAIVGLGTMGSFTALELARRDASVIGFDQFAPPHHRGSHTGETRVFRIAYSEHPSYVPLAQRAGLLWDRLSQEFGSRLLARSGLLSMGTEDSDLISGIRSSASLYNLSVETLTAIEIRRHFPALCPPEDFIGLLEKEAGWIEVDAAIENALMRAQALGARLLLDSPALGWEARGRQVSVRTERGDFSAEKLIITAGAWTNLIMLDLALPLTIKRKILAWLDPVRPEYFTPGELPVFAFAPNFFYGFPNVGLRGVKIAEHLGGRQVLNLQAPVEPPGPDDLAPLLQAASKFVPSLLGPSPGQDARVLRAKTCLYTMTPDEHFIIDQHPLFEGVVFAGGFSGHGFKFAPVVAEALADLALEGKTTLPIAFLRLKNRFG
jgi:sarcosine oxidase